MDRPEKAVKIFNSGFNCAQSVVMAHAPLIASVEEDLQGYPSGFGGGMGKVQTVCGAASGAVMVIGRLVYRRDNREESKEEVYRLVREFLERFRGEFQSLECIDLTGVDISTPEGMAEAEERGIFRDKCEGYVAGACRILEEILPGGEKR